MAQSDLEVEFDTHDPRIAADPYPAYAELRARCPMAWSRAWGGFWIASHHAEVSAAASDRTFKTAHVLADGTVQGVSIPSQGQTFRLIPLEVEPPGSSKYRRLLTSFYSASRIRARLPEFRSVASAGIDDIIGLGSCDIVGALTSRLPGIIIMRDIGMPESRWQEIDHTIHRALLSSPHDLDGAKEAALLVCQEIIEAIEAHRPAPETGGRSIIGHLLGSLIDDTPLSYDDIISTVYLLILGIDPVSTLTATSLWYLARHPDVRRQLIADLSLIPKATEEFLRLISPIQGTSRTVSADISLGGQSLRAGERVLLSWASANRDEEVFPEADRVDLQRDRGHLAFGHGTHYCLGAHLVRALSNVMLREVLTRMPEYELDESAGIQWFPDLSSIYGVRALPIKFPSAR